MRVKHTKPQNDVGLASVKGDKFCYRTEVTNSNDVPIKIVWFDFYYMHDGHWNATNITNGVMREENFLKWYADAEDKDENFSDGWLLPGKTATCDPNWNFGCDEQFYRAKWAFIAVDATGETYFDEAEVSKDCVVFCTDSES